MQYQSEKRAEEEERIRKRGRYRLECCRIIFLAELFVLWRGRFSGLVKSISRICRLLLIVLAILLAWVSGLLVCVSRSSTSAFPLQDSSSLDLDIGSFKNNYLNSKR